MSAKSNLHRAVAATTMAAMCFASVAPAVAGQRVTKHKSAPQSQDRTRARVASLPVGTQRPTSEVLLSVGEGQLVTLPANVANVWTSNPGAADVYVNSQRQIYLFGKDFGEATVFATDAGGHVVYSTQVRVAQNINSVDKMMKLAMPESDIHVATAGQIAVITGTVLSPEDSVTAERLVLTMLNPGVDVSKDGAMLKIAVINRLKTATPLQVNLQVRIAEVSRSFVKNIGSNVLTRDLTGGFKLGISSGQRVPGTIGSVDTSALPMLDASSKFGFPAGTLSLPYDPRLGDFVYPGTGTAFNWTKGTQNGTIALMGKLFGVDALAALDLGERIGQVTTLAQPNLTAKSGETASFLAGGEIPIPVPQASGTGGSVITVEYKQYGVSLSFTPTVMSDGRISMRVRPEVSELSSAGAVQMSGVTIPALTTRRVETSVDLGSGQSFMIAGLLSNQHNNQIDKTPGVGDVPILGALFRSNAFQRDETELVVVITPYLVKPVNGNDIALPTDGYKAPNDFDRVFMGQLNGGTTGGDRPKPKMEVPAGAEPTVGSLNPVGPAPQPVVPRQQPAQADKPKAVPPQKKKAVADAGPGFGL